VTAKEIKELIKRLESPLSILVITASAYASAFGYEDGYLSYFGVPVEFAAVDLRSLLICVSAVLVGVVVIVGAGLVLLELTPKSVPKNRRFVIVYVVWLFLVAVVASQLLPGPAVFRLAVACVAPLALAWIIFVQPLFSQRSTHGYWKKFEAALKADENVLSPDGDPSKTVLFITSVILAALIVAPFLAYSIGDYAARHQEVFLIPRGERCVVLRAQTEGFLCATYEVRQSNSEQRRTACGEYKFIKPEGAKLELQFLGELEKASWKHNYWPFEQGQLGYVECGERATVPSAGTGRPPDPKPPDPADDKPPAH